MEKARMKKHAGEQWQKSRLESQLAAKKGGEVGWNHGVGQHKQLLVMGRQCELIEKHNHVREKECDVYDRIASGRIVVLERNEHVLLSTAE
jgi:hypothetical protein